MPWGAVAGAAIGLVGDQMSKDKNGGAGTTTQQPWAPATPWLLQNINQGQALQQQLQAQPFSAKQQAAYDNTYAANDFTRSLVPSLLTQLQGQQVGFDKSNPTAKQKAWDWNLLSDPSAMGMRSVSGAKEPEKAPEPEGQFKNYVEATGTPMQYYGAWMNPNANRMLTDGGDALRAQFLANQGGAGYGSFKYGEKIPEKGTKKYRDYQEYLAYGGADPYGIYSQPAAGLLGNPGGMGAATDDGGAAAAVGSSANF